MPKVIKRNQLEMKHIEPSVKDFTWDKSEKLNRLVGSDDYVFDIKNIGPGHFSYPYHYHYNCEEIFVILSGSITLRTPEGFTELSEGDVIFFEKGPSGAHQLYNHTHKLCSYLDIKSNKDLDICEYPDSKKINIINENVDISLKGENVGYFYGEDHVRDFWKQEGYIFE